MRAMHVAVACSRDRGAAAMRMPCAGAATTHVAAVDQAGWLGCNTLPASAGAPAQMRGPHVDSGHSAAESRTGHVCRPRAEWSWARRVPSTACAWPRGTRAGALEFGTNLGRRACVSWAGDGPRERTAHATSAPRRR